MNASDVFRYDGSTGYLHWKVKRKGTRSIRGFAGTINNRGYVVVELFEKKQLAHRVIWEMERGPIPDGMCIDHIDGDTQNNRIENLRLATLSENQRNAKLPKNNKTGIQGVQRVKSGFVVRIGRKYLKHTQDFFDACCLRKAAEQLNGFHENHGRRSA